MEPTYFKDSTENTYRGGFNIIPIFETTLIGESTEITGGSKNERFKNKAIPFGLALRKEKQHISYECKNGNVLDNDMFEKLFNSVAKVERSKKTESNKTKKIK
jgi:hypothetical protein